MAGTSYNGLPANVASPASVNISSSTNTSPIVVQTSSAHGMKTGDYVHIQRHLVNTNANGIWPVVVIDSTHFSLTGSTGNGVGGSGAGQVAIPLTFTGNVSLNPANGDPYDASTFIPGMSCLADRTAYAALNLGAYKIAGKFFANGGAQFNSWATVVGGLGGQPTPVDWSSGSVMPFVNGGTGNLLDVVAGDLVLVQVSTSFDALVGNGDSATTRYAILLTTANWQPGASPSYLIQGDLEVGVHVPAAGSIGEITPISFTALINCGFSGFFDFKLMIEANGNTTRTLSLDGLYRASALVLRPTLWSQ